MPASLLKSSHELRHSFAMPPGAGLKNRKDTDFSNDSFGDELQFGLNFDSQGGSKSTAKFNFVDAAGSIQTGSSEDRESARK